MPNPEIEEFAKILVQQVRDAAIGSGDRRLRGGPEHAVTKRWREAAADGDLDAIATVLIPDIVDDTIFHLLRAIDQELLRLSFTTFDGKTIDLPADGLGELSGWYMGSGGWRATYSHERSIDDFSDLK
jgi:hypothetical protein